MSNPLRDQVFISYRRVDTDASANALRQSLEHEFGDAAVFQDVQDIGGGDSFPAVLEVALDRVAVMLVVIGPTWLTVQDKFGDRRLKLEGDWVALEVSTALANPDITVFPLLVDGAAMPTTEELERLPEGLRGLGLRQGWPLRHEAWDLDISPVIDTIRNRIGRTAPNGEADEPIDKAIDSLGVSGGYREDYRATIDAFVRFHELRDRCQRRGDRAGSGCRAWRLHRRHRSTMGRQDRPHHRGRRASRRPRRPRRRQILGGRLG